MTNIPGQEVSPGIAINCIATTLQRSVIADGDSECDHHKHHRRLLAIDEGRC